MSPRRRPCGQYGDAGPVPPRHEQESGLHFDDGTGGPRRGRTGVRPPANRASRPRRRRDCSASSRPRRSERAMSRPSEERTAVCSTWATRSTRSLTNHVMSSVALVRCATSSPSFVGAVRVLLRNDQFGWRWGALGEAGRVVAAPQRAGSIGRHHAAHSLAPLRSLRSRGRRCLRRRAVVSLRAARLTLSSSLLSPASLRLARSSLGRRLARSQSLRSSVQGRRHQRRWSHCRGCERRPDA